MRLKNIIIIIALLLLGAVAYLLKLPPALFPNTLRGEFMDISLNNNGTLWILTDGSFKYVSASETPGHISRSTKGLFCKTFLYLYDPANKKILKTIKTEYTYLPNKFKLLQTQNQLWEISQRPYPPLTLTVYDPKTGAQLMDLAGFLADHSQLNSGLVDLSSSANPDRLELDTKDGRKFLYLVKTKQFFSYEPHLAKQKVLAAYQAMGLSSLFVLAGEGSFSDARKRLYLVKGSAAKLADEFYWPFNNINSHMTLQAISFGRYSQFSLKSLTPAEVYLEGVIIYQDKELVIIFHQDQVGRDAKRILTCIDKNGQRKWTVPPEDLFPQLMASSNRSFSSMFFTKGYVSGERQANLFVLKVRQLGAIGFDIKTGKKLWTLRL